MHDTNSVNKLTLVGSFGCVVGIAYSPKTGDVHVLHVYHVSVSSPLPSAVHTVVVIDKISLHEASYVCSISTNTSMIFVF